MIDIYVPVIGNGKEWTDPAFAAEPDKHKAEGPYRADVPKGIAWRYNDSIPCWLAGPRLGQPINNFACVQIKEADLAYVPARTDPRTLLPIDRLAADMVRNARANWKAAIPGMFKARQQFDYADNATRTRAADLLAEAVRRGLDPKVAAETAASCNLLTAEISSGSR